VIGTVNENATQLMTGRAENRDFPQFLFHHPFYFQADEPVDYGDVCHALMVGHHHIGVVVAVIFFAPYNNPEGGNGATEAGPGNSQDICCILAENKSHNNANQP